MTATTESDAWIWREQSNGETVLVKHGNVGRIGVKHGFIWGWYWMVHTECSRVRLKDGLAFTRHGAMTAAAAWILAHPHSSELRRGGYFCGCPFGREHWR